MRTERELAQLLSGATLLYRLEANQRDRLWRGICLALSKPEQRSAADGKKEEEPS